MVMMLACPATPIHVWVHVSHIHSLSSAVLGGQCAENFCAEL